jgi:hypothetical protein
MDDDGTGKSPQARCVLEHHGGASQQPYEVRRERRVQEVVKHREDADEPDLRHQFVELRAAEERAWVRPPEGSGNRPVRPQYDVPGIAFEEDDVTAGLKPFIDLLEQPGAVSLVEQIHGNDVGKAAPLERTRERLCPPIFDRCGQLRPRCRGAAKAHGGDGVLTARDLVQATRQPSLAGAELEHVLAR